MNKNSRRPDNRSTRYHSRERKDNGKIDSLLKKIKSELADSIDPISLPQLNAFERKLVHRHFDNNPNVKTRTYRNGDDYELRIYPVGNLRKYAEQKAEEAIETSAKVVLPHMNDFERFVIHDALKNLDSVKSASHGEGNDRHVEIEPAVFGRGLKKIIKKIRLF